MKHITESIKSNINEASQKYEVMFLSADDGAWQGWEDEELTLGDLEEQMYENEEIPRMKFTAPSDDAAIKKVEKELKKQKYDVRECIAATIYLDSADDGEVVETVFTPEWIEFGEENE